jgi:N-acetylneuraminic acid mutarotase
MGIGIGTKAYAGTGHQNGTGVDTWYPDWWEYDPATNAWTQKTDYPGNNGNGDQDVAIIATSTVAYAGMGQLDGNGFYKYDPQTNLWTQVTSPPAGASFNNLFPFTIDEVGYFPSLFSTSFYKYDPALDLWTQLGNLPFSTFYGTPSFSINDKGYIKDGANFWEYDPTTDVWTPKAPFPGLYPNRPASIGQYNHGFIIGGFSGNPSVLPWEWGSEVWRYDPVTDTWLQMEEFPGTTRRWAVAMSVGDRVYYGLGTNGTNFNDFWEFNSIAETKEQNATSVTAYPTLADDRVNFASEEVTNFEVEVVDLLGNKVAHLKATTGKTQLDREFLAAGTYIYRIRIEGSVVHSDRFIFK